MGKEAESNRSSLKPIPPSLSLLEQPHNSRFRTKESIWMIYLVVSFESRWTGLPRVLCVDLSATRKGQGYIGWKRKEKEEGGKIQTVFEAGQSVYTRYHVGIYLEIPGIDLTWYYLLLNARVPHRFQFHHRPRSFASWYLNHNGDDECITFPGIFFFPFFPLSLPLVLLIQRVFHANSSLRYLFRGGERSPPSFLYL